MLMPSIFGEDLFDDFMSDFPFFDDKAERRLEKKAVWPPGQKSDEDRCEGDGYRI